MKIKTIPTECNFKCDHPFLFVITRLDRVMTKFLLTSLKATPIITLLLTLSLWAIPFTTWASSPITKKPSNNKEKTIKLPDLGERSETFISREQEKQLGKEFMKMVRLQLPILNDAIINDYIQKLGDKLASNANTKRKKFHFFIVEDPIFNAFAGPDAYIGINSGTITFVNSEDELAAIMAHEIAHVTQHHIARLVNRAKNTQIAAAAGMLAGMIIGATTSNSTAGNVASGVSLASLGAATQHLITFTREHEIEADYIGMQILHRSSFNPNAMPSTFSRMQHLYHNYSNEVPKFLRTHPVTSDRIAEAKNRASRYKFNENNKRQNHFDLIKIRTEIITSDNLPRLIKGLKIKLKTKKSKILEYGLALALYKNLDFTQAKKIALELSKKYPNEPPFQMLAAEIELSNKEATKARLTLKPLLSKHQNYYPLILQYADTLVKAKKFKEAIAFIRKKTRLHKNDGNLYYLLSQAYAKNNQKDEAYIARAKAFRLIGLYQRARILLQQALKIPKLSTNNRAIINARIKQINKIEKPRGNL